MPFESDAQRKAFFGKFGSSGSTSGSQYAATTLGAKARKSNPGQARATLLSLRDLKAQGMSTQDALSHLERGGQVSVPLHVTKERDWVTIRHARTRQILGADTSERGAQDSALMTLRTGTTDRGTYVRTKATPGRRVRR